MQNKYQIFNMRESRYERTRIVRRLETCGESLEEQIRAALAGNEPIEARAPMIYTEKADGVRPEFDIRTDRQELAIEATNKYAASVRASSDTNPKDNTTQTEPKTE